MRFYDDTFRIEARQALVFASAVNAGMAGNDASEQMESWRRLAEGLDIPTSVEIEEGVEVITNPETLDRDNWIATNVARGLLPIDMLYNGEDYALPS